ncbi:MAG: hypothetical protein K1X50_21270 [Candidatus Promineofilum sp.]|jgi:pectin methylesterase-like acyl-CoA thioesterase|nr:hypothetical protein [Promineifilum sp.]MCW5865389.1 hypothetical protein [Anaerolineae bacterium]
MNTPIEVDCTFEADGRVRVRRVRLGRPWQPVEQGRQWADADGRHVLIMLAGGVHELLLRADTLTWELRELPGSRRAA